MNALVLAAGYAVRLRPLTLNNAKPLLPIGGQPMINYIVEKIDELPEVDRIYIVVNDKFFEHFRAWATRAPAPRKILLVNDGSTRDENRLGAVADINFVIEKERIEDDLLVVGGDNLFDFGLSAFVSFFKEKGTSVALRVCDDPGLVRRYSTVELDETGRIAFFAEKAHKPRSNLIAICLYLFDKASLHLVKDYLQQGGTHDAPGYYIQWLYKQIPLYGKVMGGSWYDIGDRSTYQQADRLFGRPSKKGESRPPVEQR